MRLMIYTTIPFICSIVGYFAMASVMKVTDIVVPDVVGRSLSEALCRLSEVQLYGHIMVEQEDADIPAGTVLEQIPRSGHHMKMRQSVGLLIVKATQKICAPYCVGRPLESVAQEVEAIGLRLKIHDLEVPGVIGTCYAQYPAAGQEAADRIIHVYRVSPPEELYCLMPNFRGQATSMVKRIAASWGVGVRVIHEDQGGLDGHDCSSCIINDHKPAPGDVIDKKKMQVLYVQVGKISA